eukprot:265192-Chlamydomonas_euryale.AAC.1
MPAIAPPDSPLPLPPPPPPPLVLSGLLSGPGTAPLSGVGATSVLTDGGLIVGGGASSGGTGGEGCGKGGGGDGEGGGGG